MSWSQSLPLLILGSSLLPGLIIFLLPEERVISRTTLNLAGAVVKIALVLAMLAGMLRGEHYQAQLPLTEGLDLMLRATPLSMLFLLLSAILWLVTTVYAVGYLEDSPNRSRFFGFFSLCVTATVGVALAGNLLTFLLFYELLTLCTYPLIVHRGTEVARRAGRNYLAYTVGGGALLLLATVWLFTLTGSLDFREGGFLAEVDASLHPQLTLVFVLLIAGLGVKAALVPLHGWLPQAMVAPAPVSALLHAVAVVKAGAFGIIRVIFDVYGINFAASLGLMLPLAALAAITIVYGSVRALFQQELKRRLAFSTVSQIAYIILGVALAGPIAATGGLVHLVHQGVQKITLFLCAGNLAETLGIHHIEEMDGVGQRMPWTMASFTLGAFGMIGAPPLAGFFSKWYLGLGALEMNQGWVILALSVSSALNAAYFLPILHRAWFREPPSSWPAERNLGNQETAWALLLPPLATAVMIVMLGVLASAPFGLVEWAGIIADRGFAP
ncbi:proton-conducting transporter membrane subunit [Ferrimonas sp. YFM]|uniref:complex I subunit 5 family protein n=1 Tax=Ferrimonas sp. YFM TaxID=3028878 RepID=UPI0025727E9B|nr:proton-conducting transporter membrane subunit [Ferrimonas sp. YFM]BDY07040.1 cation:proton antiporter [Ferrimonas sp. YFM]